MVTLGKRTKQTTAVTGNAPQLQTSGSCIFRRSPGVQASSLYATCASVEAQEVHYSRTECYRDGFCNSCVPQ